MRVWQIHFPTWIIRQLINELSWNSARKTGSLWEIFKDYARLFHLGAKNNAPRCNVISRAILEQFRRSQWNSARLSRAARASVISTSLVSLREFKGSLTEREELAVWNWLIQEPSLHIPQNSLAQNSPERRYYFMTLNKTWVSNEVIPIRYGIVKNIFLDDRMKQLSHFWASRFQAAFEPLIIIHDRRRRIDWYDCN